MKRLAPVALLSLVLALAFGSLASAQPAPEFRLGFKALADQVPEVAGQPLENEHWGDNGDSLQQTSTGLMAWRKADNWTAFTDGFKSWVNGPNGVQTRFNSERFAWEPYAVGTTVIPNAPPPAPVTAPVRPSGSGYYNVDGIWVPSPGSSPTGASAICRDGTYSYSQNRSGTCSSHGGVRQWLR